MRLSIGVPLALAGILSLTAAVGGSATALAEAPPQHVGDGKGGPQYYPPSGADAPVDDFADGAAGVGDPEVFGLAGSTGADLGVSSIAQAPNYIDWAVPMNQVRLRYDHITGANRPDRAEYFYPTYSGAGGPIPGRGFVGELDMQVGSVYLEKLLSPRLSAFVNLPIRNVEFSILDDNANLQNIDTTGLGDVDAGFKYAFFNNCCGDYLTFQFRVYSPTGDEDRGLGTGHVALEPGILFQRNLGNYGLLFGEVKNWIGIDSTVAEDNLGGPIIVDRDLIGRDFGGNVMQYGLGHAYNVWTSYCGDQTLAVLNEFVGWTVLDGLQSTPTTPAADDATIVDANGETIVNYKVGLRYTRDWTSVSVSYGTNLTDARWYSDIVRVQMQQAF